MASSLVMDKDGKTPLKQQPDTDLCMLCNVSEKRKYNIIVQCFECHQNPKGRGKQKFHPMCAWRRGNQFSFEIKGKYDESDTTLELKANSVEFSQSFYKDAF